ncbi:hypothetical protein U1Q18_052298 [Sarracenia purpurea var. burkii]
MDGHRQQQNGKRQIAQDKDEKDLAGSTWTTCRCRASRSNCETVFVHDGMQWCDKKKAMRPKYKTMAATVTSSTSAVASFSTRRSTIRLDRFKCRTSGRRSPASSLLAHRWPSVSRRPSSRDLNSQEQTGRLVLGTQRSHRAHARRARCPALAHARSPEVLRVAQRHHRQVPAARPQASSSDTTSKIRTSNRRPLVRVGRALHDATLLGSVHLRSLQAGHATSPKCQSSIRLRLNVNVTQCE